MWGLEGSRKKEHKYESSIDSPYSPHLAKWRFQRTGAVDSRMFKRIFPRNSQQKEADNRPRSPESALSKAGSTSELPLASPNYRGRDQSPILSGLGLHVIHSPDFASVDIIFVHGLGGHSQRTWSKNHDPSLFWPELWLPLETDVGTARILTFGYDANFRGTTLNIFSSVTDFAKELLFEMRFAKDKSGTDLRIGTSHIIFVVHNMGGLVVKKALLLGIHDRSYKHI